VWQQHPDSLIHINNVPACLMEYPRHSGDILSPASLPANGPGDTQAACCLNIAEKGDIIMMHYA
jgi:hypothetical protein